jgi:hypothetical protein
MTPKELMTKYSITFDKRFIPFSVSRSKDSKYPNLNWRIDFMHNGKALFSFDYSAGSAHCPAYKWKKSNYVSPAIKSTAIGHECETGKHAKKGFGDNVFASNKAIIPDYESALYSLVMDSDVINYSSFSDWAENFGYSGDSIEAKGIYDGCLSIALQFRGNLGETFFVDAVETFEDY